MRSRGSDVNEGDGRSDAGSSRSEEETHSRHGSQRSGKSSRNNEEPNYGSEDSSSKNTSGNNNPIEYTEQERAELLRRLDSIKDHLLRGGGGNAADKPKEAFLRPQPYYHNPYPEPYPYAGPMYPQGYHQDPYGFQVHRRPPPVPNPNWYPPPPPYPPRPYPGGGGQYVEIGADIVEPHSFFPATPSRYGGDMPPYSPVSSHNRGGGAAPYSPSSMSSPGPRGGGGGGGYARWPSDLDSEMGGGAFARGYVKKAVSDRDARRCHPLAGGAPFIACHSCFELLYLPKKKLLAQERKLHKLQCGSCSQVISFTIVDKKLVFSSGNEEANPVSLEVVTNTVVVEERSSVDEDEEAIKESRNHQETTQSVGTASSQCSDDEEISSEQEQREVKSVRRRAQVSKSPEPAASESASLLELFEYSNVNRAALAYGMAELGYHKPDKKEFFVKKDSPPKKPESVATETEVSYNGYSNTEISEDSRNSNGREEDNNRRSEFGGSTEITNGNEDQGKLFEVWVNGHLIPEDLVSSAEKLAGPIQAGKYWYDYRAGFWGVMDKPCLGIIPPFIEEFSHPMPDRCAAGNSEVYVNGRELHKRDFELLVGRGLPRDKNRSYILDISGRILDGDSGEELKSLGKLAPTIEKVKHGFGMRVPRSLAS
ncbi:unnamed protein product [Microthlaspi erraticum]|uniref:Probable zinc-ribbon domain-containing protein n=1 Tax=Microthlaspi erraticum TaxID=1685480 RepID=A0A6D2JKL2_9BRAS|nr:unnamed protein product [Microthlaspi erraticum]